MDWQSIETAPKGGKWILLWWPSVTSVPFVGFRAGKQWRAAVEGSYWIDIDPPTHWMPLPDPPLDIRK